MRDDDVETILFAVGWNLARVSVLMRENLNTIVFAVGLTLTCAGLWCLWSWGVAAIFVGAVLMVVCIYPYVRMGYRQ